MSEARPAIYTIGFAGKSAERFFGLLAEAGVRRLLDTRLRPGGQLAGFARGGDLPFFLRRLNGCDYRPLPILAPTPEILDDFRKDKRWDRYVERFEALMDERGVPGCLDRAELAATPSCLLCSEATPERCHRRLVAERIARAWPELAVVHLV